MWKLIMLNHIDIYYRKKNYVIVQESDRRIE